MTDNPAEILESYHLARIEALLFVASAPATASQIGEALSMSVKEVEAALDELQHEYEKKRGIAIQSHGGRYQLTTASEFAEDVEKFLGIESTSKLSRAGIETMAIVAYHNRSLDRVLIRSVESAAMASLKVYCQRD